jgi:hypothetical protein
VETGEELTRVRILPRDPRTEGASSSGRSRRPSTALMGCAVYTKLFMLRNMKSRFDEETNGGKSRGVVMIYFSCEPGKTYGVVLIFFYGW